MLSTNAKDALKLTHIVWKTPCTVCILHSHHISCVTYLSLWRSKIIPTHIQCITEISRQSPNILILVVYSLYEYYISYVMNYISYFLLFQKSRESCAFVIAFARNNKYHGYRARSCRRNPSWVCYLVLLYTCVIRIARLFYIPFVLFSQQRGKMLSSQINFLFYEFCKLMRFIISLVSSLHHWVPGV